MKLYDTFSRQLQELKPLNPPEVTIYTCGPTVYDHAHIGNLSGYIYWDVLVRALELNNLVPKRVINLTDVGHLVSDADEGEDKLVQAAARDQKTAWEVAEYYTQAFLKDFKRLNLKQPWKFARATDFIEAQLDIVRNLKKLGLTYQIDDGIYLDTSQIKDYGQLAKLDLDSLQAGARVAVNEQKKQATDFALWKFSDQSKQRDMEWATPSDLLDDPTLPKMGFPGWHLECSAIIRELLGDQIDIHGGGIDHIPVHHTNEIAQMTPLTGKPVAQIWIHNNHMRVDGQKISKSLGNGYTLNDLIERGFSAMDFKLLVLQGHYQSESNFSFNNLTAAQHRLQNWRKTACLRHQLYGQISKGVNFLAAKRHLVELANDNLNTPQICAEIDNAVTKTNNNLEQAVDQVSLRELFEIIDQLLGLNIISSTPDIQDQPKKIIRRRQIARDNGDFKTADKLRQELAKQGIGLDDRTSQSYWYHL